MLGYDFLLVWHTQHAHPFLLKYFLVFSFLFAAYLIFDFFVLFVVLLFLFFGFSTVFQPPACAGFFPFRFRRVHAVHSSLYACPESPDLVEDGLTEAFPEDSTQ